MRAPLCVQKKTWFDKMTCCSLYNYLKKENSIQFYSVECFWDTEFTFIRKN